MLYTIIPVEEIWGPDPALADIPTLAVVGGTQLLVTRLPDGTGRVERLLSTNPFDYLNVDFTPGAILDAGVIQ
ncbi:MAG: YlzJ-like family protein [Firmicutes bacterium]|jgi:hypothetical protein|nr:YlzJ-like family protein [Bacillota bacterium]